MTSVDVIAAVIQRVKGLVEFDSLVTHTLGLDQMPEAFAVEPSPATLKRIVRPSVARLE